MLNLVRAGPRLLNLVRIGLRLLKLIRVSRCLLNLVQAGQLIVGGCSSGAALVRDGHGRGRYRRGCGGSHVRCGRAVLASDDPSRPSAGLSVTLCFAQR